MLGQFCILAADVYLVYLDADQNRGGVVVTVNAKTQLSENQWRLSLNGRLRNTDGVALKVAGDEISRDRFLIESYDDERRMLVLQFPQPYPAFQNAGADSIVLFSDLRFLVRNVRQWYENHGSELAIPALGSGLPPDSRVQLNCDQNAAASMALSEPLSYVWGPPGTGKTRHVLASCILAHLEHDHTAAILAPTNNALDVAMRGVLETARSLGVNLNKFLRLGTPGAKFAQDYPEQCEVRGVEVALTSVRNEMQRWKRLRKFREQQVNLEQLQEEKRRVEVIKRGVSAYDETCRKIGNIQVELAELRRALESFGVRWFGWATSRRKRIDHDIAQRDKRMGDLQPRATEQKLRIEQKWTSLKAMLLLHATIAEHEDELRCDGEGLDRIARRLEEKVNATENWLANNDDLESATEAKEEIEVKIDSLGQREQKLLTQSLETRLMDVRIVGLTMDAWIGSYKDKLPPFHQIFIDEAPYVPLIKALTVFRHGVPVTLLGDHRQLPPVCEMNEDYIVQFNCHPGILWVRSSVFVPLALSTPYPEVDSLPEKLLDPALEPVIEMSFLKISHRFGDNLAELLDELVYGGLGLRSAVTEDPLIVDIVHVPGEQGAGWNNASQGKRSALLFTAEIQDGVNCAVLTPYRGQASGIQSHLPPQVRDYAMTVHKSQGQEWDTIIFCAADISGRNPFLTNSEFTQGRTCLNTALSRVRRKLILVLDVGCWRNRQDRRRQLLSRVVEMGM